MAASALDSQIQKLQDVTSRLEKIAGRLGRGGAGGSEGEGEGVSPTVVDFDAYYNQHVAKFISVAKSIPKCEKIAELTETSFKFCRTVIEAASQCKKPSNKELVTFIDPIVKSIQQADKLCDNRSSVFPHQKSFAEAIQCLNWLMVPTTMGTVQAALESADFYLNKILVSAKNESTANMQQAFRDYVSSLKAMLNELKEYCKNNFKAGLDWNPQGKPLSEFSAGSGSGSSSSAPAPPAPVIALDLSVTDAPEKESGSSVGMAAVFAQLNKGEAVTSGLRHITKDMTNKNKKISGKVDLPEKKESSSASKKPSSAPVSKPASTTLRQGTWFVENYSSDQVDIDDVQMKQSIYIFNCNDAVVRVTKKCKSIQIDKCNKLQLQVDSVVSSIEIVNSARVTLWVMNNAPTVAIDKSNGIQVCLTKDSMKNPPELVTSAISEVNVLLPGKTDNDDPVEHPVPEQFSTKIVNGALVTEAVKHGSG